MREYDEDDDDIRLYAPVLRRVIIVVAVIIAVPMMMWTTTIFIRSYSPKTPTFRHLTLTEPLPTVGLPPTPQAAQPAPAPLPPDAARTAGDGLASFPNPNSESLKGPLAPPPEDAPPPAASPTGPAETAPNAPVAASGESAVTDSAQSAATAEASSSEAVTTEPIRGSLGSLPDPDSGSLKGTIALPPADAPPATSPTGPAETAPNAPVAASGGAAAVTDNAQSAATAETASSEAVTPEPIKGRKPLPRDRTDMTMAAARAGSIAPVSPVPLPRVRPANAPVDTPPVPSSPPSGSPLFAHPAAYGYQPGLER